MKKNWKNVLLYIVRIIELLSLQALPEGRKRLMRTVSLIIVHCFCQQGGQCLASGGH